MKLQTLIDSNLFELVNRGDDLDRDISKVFCCDLLSIAMGRAPMDGAWVTVMANMNTLAVAALTDTSCIILAEGLFWTTHPWRKLLPRALPFFHRAAGL